MKVAFANGLHIEDFQFSTREKFNLISQLRIYFIIIPLFLIASGIPNIGLSSIAYTLTFMTYAYLLRPGQENENISELKLFSLVIIDSVFFLFLCIHFIHLSRYIWLLGYLNIFLSAFLLNIRYSIPIVLFHLAAIWYLKVKFYFAFVNPGPLDQYLPYLFGIFIFVLAKIFSRQLEKAQSEIASVRGKVVENDKLRALGAMFSGISHEFGTQINAIKLKASRLEKDGIEGIDSINTAMKNMEQTLKKMHLSNNISDQDFIESLNLAEVIKNTIDTWSFDREVLVDIRIPENISIITNLISFTQVVLTILDNSFEATQKGHKCHVVISYCKKTYTLMFTDNGVGFDHKVINDLGKPFITTKNSGTGLGLYTVHLFMSSLGGDVHFTNSSGASVALIFPKEAVDHD